MAFHNSASVPTNQLEVFFNTLKVETIGDIAAMEKPNYNNLSAWMDAMTTPFYPGKGENSPIVYTTRHNYGEWDLQAIHYDTNLYTGQWVVENPEPKDSSDVAITAHTSLGANVQSCAPPQDDDYAYWGCI